MAQTLDSRRVAFSQKLIAYLVVVDFILIGAYAALAQNLSPGATLTIPALLVSYNVLLSWLVILRTRRRSDRALIYTMTISILLLAVSLLSHLIL